MQNLDVTTLFGGIILVGGLAIMGVYAVQGKLPADVAFPVISTWIGSIVTAWIVNKANQISKNQQPPATKP